MTASKWTDEPLGDDDDRRSRYRQASDDALVSGMRALDPLALEEFIQRFQHTVLIQARRLRIPIGERRGWAIELLYDVGTSLCRTGESRPPRSLTAYLITACRRRVFAAARDRAVRERLDREQADALGGIGEHAILATSSAHSIRCTHGPEWNAVALPAVLERLVSLFRDGMSDEERKLLSSVGRRIPYRVLAEWLGVSRSAAVKRVTRLRARLVDATFRFGETLDRQERHELLRFLRRTGAFTEEDLRALTAFPDHDVMEQSTEMTELENGERGDEQKG